jgi:hypothetical protein
MQRELVRLHGAIMTKRGAIVEISCRDDGQTSFFVAPKTPRIKLEAGSYCAANRSLTIGFNVLRVCDTYLPALIQARGKGRVNSGSVGVQNPGKEGVEDHERCGSNVEKPFLAEDRGEPGIIHHEGGRRGKNTIHLRDASRQSNRLHLPRQEHTAR